MITFKFETRKDQYIGFRAMLHDHTTLFDITASQEEIRDLHKQIGNLLGILKAQSGNFDDTSIPNFSTKSNSVKRHQLDLFEHGRTDVHTKTDPMTVPDIGYTIKTNAIQCNHCKDVIISRHCHDFVACSCGKVAVDGGLDYLRRVGNHGDWIELSEYAGDQPEGDE